MSFVIGMKTIVVATDLDGRSEAALEYARKLATAYSARIVLAYTLDPMDYAAVGRIPGGILHEIPQEVRAVLGKMMDDLMQEGIHSHSEFRQGAVAQMLIDVAKQHDAGLIVIGTEGGQGAGAIAVGSIAEQLVRLSACPVLAVAADWNAGLFRPTPGGPVMLAMETNEATEAALETAHSLAVTFQRALFVVHARTAAEVTGSLNPSESTLEDFGIRSSDAVSVRCLVEYGEPADAVANAIEQHHPSILVVGVKRRSETPGPHGTAFSLLARSRVPVLCVPEPALPVASAQSAVESAIAD